MRVITKTANFMLSSFEASEEDIEIIAIAVATAMKLKYRSPETPVIIKNANDDFFGKSVNIVYKYHFHI